MKFGFAVVCSLFFSLCVARAVCAEDVYTFTVRGVVKALPGKGLAANEILVKHEPIPEYRDESGKVVGMMAMTMPFYLSEKISLEGIKEGDAVEFVVEQRIKPTFTEQVISLTRKR